jgi:hypothetical protein
MMIKLIYWKLKNSFYVKEISIFVEKHKKINLLKLFRSVNFNENFTLVQNKFYKNSDLV